MSKVDTESRLGWAEHGIGIRPVNLGCMMLRRFGNVGNVLENLNFFFTFITIRSKFVHPN